MTTPPFPVLYEDNHLLVVVKPATLPTMGVAEDKPSLLQIAKQYIKQKYKKPGNVYLGTVSRLDAPVSGVVIFARTSKAAARLSEQFRERTVEKTYWAVVEEPLDPIEGRLIDWLRKDERHRKMHVTRQKGEGAQEARLSYQVLQEVRGGVLLQIALETGRKHQIRVQLGSRGHAIIGDRKYGSDQPFAAGIALHSRRLVVEHPVLKEGVELIAPLPKCWNRFGPLPVDE